MRFASGKSAWFRCGRCGDRGKYVDSVSDGQLPGLRVHPGCRDEKHPVEKPFKADDAVALQYPGPDIDDDSDGSIEDATGTAQAGTANTITLASTASAQTDGYINSTITLTGGTGSGQSRTILDYDGVTKVATVAAWTTPPDSTSTYSIAVPLLAGSLGFSNHFGGGT